MSVLNIAIMEIFYSVIGIIIIPLFFIAIVKGHEAIVKQEEDDMVSRIKAMAAAYDADKAKKRKKKKKK